MSQVRPRHVVIVGGGITGLAAARALEQQVKGPLRVTLLEAADRLGGNISTVRHNGFTVDAGPDSWVSTKPEASKLAEDVGLAKDIISTQESSRKVYILNGGKLAPLPEGFVLGIPTEMTPVLRSGLFTWDEIARMGLDYFVPRRTTTEDESVADFLARRLGDPIVDKIAGPLLGGIFAGDARTISVRAAFPQFVAAEAKHGSLIRAMQAAKKERKKKDGSAFLSLKGGMSDLVTATAHLLKVADVRKNERVLHLSRTDAGDARGRFAVETSKEVLFADDVVLAIPPVVARKLLTELSPSFDALYAGLRANSTATVFLGYRSRSVSHPLDATGFIVPATERRPILASTWVTSKWEHRAPAGHVMLRLFFGGASGEEVLESDDYGLVAIARRQLAEIMDITALPVFSRVFRFDKASPQMNVGHLERLKAIQGKLAELPGLYVAANGYQGTGIPDCIKQGIEVAARIAATPAGAAAST
jgi:oxygen-dependent protoporphyrinogen oxidase